MIRINSHFDGLNLDFSRLLILLVLSGENLSIYIRNQESNEEIAHLAKEEWELPAQIESLENWLNENDSVIAPGNYVADIGFSMRKNACGGGAILSVKAMSIMSRLGMKLYLSEYPDD